MSYPGEPTVSYTYDAAGNRKTETRGGSTTNYDYDAAGQLVTVGNKTYTYDANGNLIQAGSDSFTWDHDNRLATATVGTHSASYTYDGDGVRTRATVDGNQANDLVDIQGGLPTLVDDDSKVYLHADGVLSEIDTDGATQLLGDALGSVRGFADTNGNLVGSRDYEAFGAPGTMIGTSSLFGFTGEPTDATGLIYLRARSLDSATGRMMSPDSVQPNAPGTQGYNSYSYVANNPATWVDPTGHQVGTVGATAAVDELVDFLLWEAEMEQGEVLASQMLAFQQTTVDVVAAGATASAVLLMAVAIVGVVLIAALLMCFANSGCYQSFVEGIGVAQAQGSGSIEGRTVWDADELLDAPTTFPSPADEPTIPPPNPPLPVDLSSCDSGADSSGIGEYGDVGGHHIHAKAAFKVVETYDADRALAIGQELMRQCGIDHSAVTSAQRQLFKELFESGRANTLAEHSRIAEEALIRGGAAPDLAHELVLQSEANLVAQGVTAPSNIPWYG